jgi:serine/threonine protein kinase
VADDTWPTANPQLIDFGFAATIKAGDADCMHERLGTPIYMAPEMWSKGEADYDSSVDVWCAP